MASAVTLVKIFANAALKLYKHNPDTASALVVSVDAGTTKNWLAMANYQNFVLIVLNHLSTSASGPTLIEILGATDSTGTNATAIVTSGAVTSVTAGDNIMIECNTDQIEEVGRASSLAFTHVTGRITTSNSGDEQGVLMGRFNPRFPASGLSANNIT